MAWNAQLSKELRELDLALRTQILSGELSRLTVLKLQAERKYKAKASRMLEQYSKLHDLLHFFNSRRVDLALAFAFISLLSMMNAYMPQIGLGGWLTPLWLFLVALCALGFLILVLAFFLEPTLEFSMPGKLKQLFEIPDGNFDNMSHDQRLELLARLEVLGSLIGMDYERMKLEVGRDMKKLAERTSSNILDERWT
ncbi:MAG: hypothetical protein JW727_05825 [Candidatus Aenigmarchaeota archaeon]|nr:hypothetical protein [Candidatus Aenigmarchaeota archaeon]